MKHTVVVAAIIAAIAVPHAQGRPDFSGTWVVDAVERPERPEGGGRRGGGPGRRGGPLAALEKGQRIRIKQTAERLTVTWAGEAGEQVNGYALDGSESTNASGRGALKSKTKWDGAALVTEGTRTMNGPMGDVTLKTREVRSLGGDGRTMTVRTTIDTPRGRRTTTVVFVKAVN